MAKNQRPLGKDGLRDQVKERWWRESREGIERAGGSVSEASTAWHEEDLAHVLGFGQRVRREDMS